jgi:hypothetical protein
MEPRQCSCGYAGQDTEFAEHLGEVFIPADDIGIDGKAHAEMAAGRAPAAARHPGAPRVPGLTCLCGFFTEEPAALDDHLLAMFITPDQVGADGARHAEEGITDPLLLCPGCCTISDVPEWVPTAEVLTPHPPGPVILVDRPSPRIILCRRTDLVGSAWPALLSSPR